MPNGNKSWIFHMYLHGMGTDSWTMWCSVPGLNRSKSNVAVHPHRTTAYCHIHNTHKHTLRLTVQLTQKQEGHKTAG